MNPLRNIAPTLATYSNSALPVLAALGLAASALAAAPKQSSDLNTLAQAAPAVLEDSALSGFIPNRSGGLNCQEEVPNPTGGAGARNYGPNFRVADNFRVTTTGSLTQVKWDAIYRAGTTTPYTNAAPPATETFTIRILTNDGPFPYPYPSGPLIPIPGLPNGVTPIFSITITNPVRAATGATSGTVTPLTVYEYTAAIAGGPTLSPGQCYWIEIQNTSPDLVTPTTPGLASVWLAGGGGGGVAGDLYAFQAPNPSSNPATPYTPFDQIPQDQAFCLNLNLTSLISNPCPLIGDGLPICSNDAANGNGTVGVGLAFTAGSAAPGSNGVSAASARTQRAENFQLSGTGTTQISSICFDGFYWNYLAVPNNPQPPTPSDLSRFVVTYFANDTITGLPATVLASFTGSQIIVLVGANDYSIFPPAITLQRGHCYFVSVAYRDDINNAAAFGRFAWDLIGLATETNPAPAVRDNRSALRTITPDGNINTPPGPWSVLVSTDGRFNLTFALSAGPAQRPDCALPAPTGACCLGVSCVLSTEADCVGAVGTTARRFRGTASLCNDPGTPPFTSNTTPCCRADFNQDGAVAPADIFAFLNNYFSTDPVRRVTCDVNGDGNVVPDADLFAFLTLFFANGC